MYNVTNIFKEGIIMKLHEYLIKFREEHKLTQRQFATICDLSNTYLKVIEDNYNPKTGKPPVLSLTTMRKIASGMGMTVQSLIETIDDEMVSSLDEAILSEDERDLIMYYRDLSIKDKHLMLALIRKIAQ